MIARTSLCFISDLRLFHCVFVNVNVTDYTFKEKCCIFSSKQCRKLREGFDMSLHLDASPVFLIQYSDKL